MSNDNTVKEKIKGIIISRLKDENKIRTLEYNTPLLSLGIDSILALSILVEIEDEFNIEIDDSDLNMDKIRNINSFAELIDSHMSNHE